MVAEAGRLRETARTAVGHTRPTVERAARRSTDGSDIGPTQGAARSAQSPSRRKSGQFTAEGSPEPQRATLGERNPSILDSFASAERIARKGLNRARSTPRDCALRAGRCGAANVGAVASCASRPAAPPSSVTTSRRDVPPWRR